MEEQANIVRASCRVPGFESVPTQGIRGNSRPVRAFFHGTAASSLFCLQSKSERCLRALLKPSAELGSLERTRSHNQIIRFLHDESGTRRPVPDLPPTFDLTLSAGNLTHELRANKRPDKVYPVRSLVRPLFILPGPIPGRRSKCRHPDPGSRRSKCIPGACDGY